MKAGWEMTSDDFEAEKKSWGDDLGEAEVRAVELGIPDGVACDARLYIDMSLREIAWEWSIKEPLELLKMLTLLVPFVKDDGAVVLAKKLLDTIREQK